jgi:hypothetical protein
MTCHLLDDRRVAVAQLGQHATPSFLCSGIYLKVNALLFLVQTLLQTMPKPTSRYVIQ